MNSGDSQGRKGIQEFLEDFGETVEDIQYDGWPIWWFFKVRFVNDGLPSWFPRHDEIVGAVKEGRGLGMSGLRLFLLRKLFWFNEFVKGFISAFNRRVSGDSGKKEIMFLVHTNAVLPKDCGFQVDRIESVIEGVRESGELREYISVVDPLSHNSGLGLLNYPDLIYKFMDSGLRRKAGEAAKKLNREYREAIREFSPNSMVHEKICMCFRPALDFFFSREVLYSVILYYLAYRNVVRRRDIRLLVVYSMNGVISRCALFAADKEAVKTLHIFHGFLSAKRITLPDSVYHAAIGERYRQDMIASGTAPRNIFVTGPVFMDEIVPYIKDKPVEGETDTVLFMSQCFVEENRVDSARYLGYMKKYLSELSRVKGIRVVIKMHPNERNPQLYESLIDSGGYGNVRVIRDKRKETFYSLINESSILISFPSTAILEALIIGTPTISLDIPECRVSDPILCDRRYLIHSSVEDDLSKQVAGILHDKKNRLEVIADGRKLVGEYLYGVDGKAGKRVYEVIEELLGL